MEVHIPHVVNETLTGTTALVAALSTDQHTPASRRMGIHGVRCLKRWIR